MRSKRGKRAGNYCLGVLKALQARELAPNHGFFADSNTDLPMAAGLKCGRRVGDISLPFATGRQGYFKNEWVTICREAENQWVGLPCGILDPERLHFGEIDRVVRIDCAHENYSTIALPPDTAFWIFDTGISNTIWLILSVEPGNQECTDALFEMRKIDDNLEHLAHGSRNSHECRFA